MSIHPKTFRIITLGCKVNQYESAYFHEVLAGAGWREAKGGERAEAVIVNTCIVTATAGHQSRQAIRKAIRENPGALVAAVGCYAQVFPSELDRIEGLFLIADNRMKTMVPQMLLTAEAQGGPVRLLRPFEPGIRFDPMGIQGFPGRSRAYVKIQDGCESGCSYCIVPMARGPCRSLAPDQVLRLLEGLSNQGYGEAVFTGIHLGMYGADLGSNVNLGTLLRKVGQEGFPLRIRLSSLEPNEVRPDLIEMVGSEPWLCRHFHIPLQSGDDRILRRMNRRYRAEEFARLVRTIHDRIPHGAIGVDIMAGFPGEDPAAHHNSYSLLKDLPVSYLHVFPFSPRPGTPASRFKGRVSPEEIRERAARLRRLSDEKRLQFLTACLKREFPVLAERWASREGGIMEGRSDNYLQVLFPMGPGSTDRRFQVRMDRIEGRRMVGSVVLPTAAA